MSAEQGFADYLRSKPALEPFLQALKHRFEQAGVWRGKIVLEDCSPALQEAMAELLGGSYWGQSTITVTAGQWRKALSKTRFEDCDLGQTLNLVFGQKIESRKMLRQLPLHQNQARFQQILESEGESPAGLWLRWLKQEQGALYTSCCNETTETLCKFAEAFNALPMRRHQVELTSVFAGRVLQDPHALDQGRVKRLLVQALRWQLLQEGNRDVSKADSWILEQGGLLRDQVSNRCLTYGLTGILSEGTEHPGWAGFVKQGEPFSATLINILEVKQIRSEARLVILENPSVFEHLASVLKGDSSHAVSLLCSEGQPAQCVWQLLQRLDRRTVQIWYCGDFDPEGLQMAQRMLDQVPGLKLWHYTVQDYDKAISEKHFDERRRRILESCTHEGLAQIRDRMMESLRCGYQEKLLEDYLQWDLE